MPDVKPSHEVTDPVAHVNRLVEEKIERLQKPSFDASRIGYRHCLDPDLESLVLCS